MGAKGSGLFGAWCLESGVKGFGLVCELSASSCRSGFKASSTAAWCKSLLVRAGRPGYVAKDPVNWKRSLGLQLQVMLASSS